MRELLNISTNLINSVNQDFRRFLYDEITWSERLIGIKGARGTGKTTLILQWLQNQDLPVEKAAYFSLDDLYFTTRSLLDTIDEFHNHGGEIVLLDEVHKYPGWSREIKNMYDRYPSLKIIFTGSSIINISRETADLSRRAILYELPGLSFREYLVFKSILNIPPFTLPEIIEKSSSVIRIFPTGFKPLEHFSTYLKYGYYPFYNDNQNDYYQRLRQLTRQIIEFDMAELKGYDNRNSKKMLQLLNILSQQVPFKPNIQKLAEKSTIHRNSMNSYLIYLEDARLIKMLYPSGNSIATLQKPEKIFLENTNMIHALAEGAPENGNIRETFFFNQLSGSHNVKAPRKGDFEVNQKYLFEVGGRSKTKKQIAGVPNSYLALDDIDSGYKNEIPLWLFGFLY
ncbi:MAG: AAA family ATPase [Bacteroidales bacterium]|nr:AAA family ATPase [Bacteroidales bacterium]MDY0286435.1 AAA family ATPase [Bacteroidales bacterium]HPE87042.1 AAA family ATPase [Bacteroidales bacterium]